MEKISINPKEFTVLVVDDNLTNLKVVVNYLREFGFKLLMVKSGQACLDTVQTRLPDIILLDVMMPEMDGFETCQRLKADEKTADIPVIFMTALASEEDKVRGFEVGAVDYVTKPIQQREVLARVMTHLRIQQLTKTLQETNHNLRDLNLSKDKFFSIVAHDLRGPFLPLLGNLELMQETALTLKPQDVQVMSAASHRSARRVFELLENLLHWAQLQMGRIEYHPLLHYLSEVVGKTVYVLANVAEVKGIRLLNEVSPEMIVHADGNMLDTVIRNLTNNALKFTAPGGQVVISSKEYGVRSREEGAGDNSVTTPYSLLPAPNYVEVSITDTGVGMNEETRQKLFKLDQHVTTTGTGKETGTGLGLIICHELVVKSGGQIWVESELGKGTTVRFTVQAAEVSK